MATSVGTNKETCRLCAGMHNKSSMTCLFTENDVGRCILERIHKYTPFQINADDCMPKFVCIICTGHIDHWHNFLQLCMKAQENFTLPAVKSQDTVDGTRVEVLPHTVTDKLSAVAHPTVDNVADNSSSESTLPSQAKRHVVLLGVYCNGAENWKTCSTPDSTVGENVCTAVVSTRKANRSTNKRRNYCIARWCNNSTKCNPSLSLFRVPKNRNRAAKWLKNAEREDLQHLDLGVLYSKFLCSEHFTEDMFTNSTMSRLVWNAVPTVFPKPHFADKMRKMQTDAAVQKMAMEMLHSSVPTRIVPKPPSKSMSSVPASANTVTQITRNSKIQEKSITNVAQVKLHSSGNNVSKLLTNVTHKTAYSSGKSGCENIVSADAQPQHSFLTESMCSFQESHEPLFPCRYCGEMFLVKSSLILHQTTYHPEHTVGCEQCGKVNYRSKSEFMGHLCEHTEAAMEQV